MPEYKAPLRDMRFLIDHVFDFHANYAALGADDASPDMINAILEEGAKFCENVLAPLNRSGDEEGCHFDNGVVTTPTGFKQAFAQYVEGGWHGLAADPTYGGQGLPSSLGLVISEMVGSSNTSWGMYPGLTHGAMSAIHAHGSAEQKEHLSEQTHRRPMDRHHVPDRSPLRHRSGHHQDPRRASGRRQLRGHRQQDFHLRRRARHERQHHPSGVGQTAGRAGRDQGHFAVYRAEILPDTAGEAGERNGVSCGSIEHKMGIKASATCVLNFDGAKGYLIGEPNKGLNCMFTMMNHARLGTGMQGLCLGEASFQGAIKYANDRLQMRSLTGAKAPDKVADPIIVHPDVRRMLLTMKAFNEGNRALTYFTAQLLDTAHLNSDADARQEAEDLLAFLTPICKAFMTDSGLEVTNLGMQIFGGHGFIREWGMEQLVRDCRIAPIYEGTNGIQALDLLGRKVLGSQGKLLRGFTKIVHKFCAANAEHPQLGSFVAQLNELNQQWGDLTMKVGMAAMKNPDEVGAASVDYLMYSGYIILGYLWLRMAWVAQAQLEAGEGEADYLRGKLATCEFYFKRLLPRTAAHRAAIEAGSDCLMKLPAEMFAL
jgi:alkylation response protein AidB-like acyl-CoA dehydrogenase